MCKYRDTLMKFFLIIFIVAVFFSYTVEIFCLGHECIGEDCNICYEVNFIKNIFECLSIQTIFFAFLHNYGERLLCILKIYREGYYLTPIKLKVKFTE